MKVSNEIIKLWRAYQNTGTPYGNSFTGFMTWLEEKVLDESIT